ncbi:MAG: hypothetical protein IPL78_22025 [Chloroflexi bacterium]|nr:hypothetical protein [Chloroflexota bacterium]
MPFNIISKIISKQDKETQSLTPQPLAGPVTPGMTDGPIPVHPEQAKEVDARVLTNDPVSSKARARN